MLSQADRKLEEVLMVLSSGLGYLRCGDSLPGLECAYLIKVTECPSLIHITLALLKYFRVNY